MEILFVQEHEQQFLASIVPEQQPELQEPENSPSTLQWMPFTLFGEVGQAGQLHMEEKTLLLESGLPQVTVVCVLMYYSQLQGMGQCSYCQV